MSGEKSFDVLIVGAGHGGAQAAIALRQLGFAGTIGIVGEEPELPYERPPLSKDYLAGEKPFERMLIRPAAFWAERAVEMLLGRRVTDVDPAARRVRTDEGETIGYGSLIWATGGKPRRLTCSGAELAGVHSIRSRADVDALIRELPRAKRIVVVGGGYIGLEAAAVLTGSGREVVLLEAQPSVLARVAGEPVSAFYEAEHRARGVDLRTGATLECIEGKCGAAAGVRILRGEIIPAEIFVVGIGIEPAVEPLLHAGAVGGDGVHVDSFCRTSLPGIFAVGDCAAHENRFAGGRRVRIESVQNAHDQASVAAAAIAGRAEPYAAMPWFWSNQYDLKLQTVGLSSGYDEVVVRGEPAGRSFSAVYLREGRAIALDCVNSVKDYVQGRKLIEAGAIVPPHRLADVSVPLKDLLSG